jgi:hypothetical protein
MASTMSLSGAKGSSVRESTSGVLDAISMKSFWRFIRKSGNKKGRHLQSKCRTTVLTSIMTRSDRIDQIVFGQYEAAVENDLPYRCSADDGCR